MVKNIFHIQKYKYSELLLLLLYIWYIFFAGLFKIVPKYLIFDDLIYCLMLALITCFGICRKGVRINKLLGLFGLCIILPSIVSAMYNFVPPRQMIGYVYILSRPLILLAFIYFMNIDIDKVFSKIIFITKLLILINLPVIVANLVKIKGNVFEQVNNDLIVGMFPFNDSNEPLTLMSIILLCEHLYAYLYDKSKRSFSMFWIVTGLSIMVATVNVKYILLVFATLFFLMLFKLKNGVYIFPVVCIVSLLVFRGLGMLLGTYYNGLIAIPIFQIIILCLTGNVEGFNLFVGAGAGMFTSTIAQDAGMPLAVKYILPIEEFFHSINADGTVTRSTSSLSTVFGDTGLLGILFIVGILIFLMIKLYKRIPFHSLFLLGFVSSVTTLFLGIFIESWMWGLDSFLFMCSVSLLFKYKDSKLV